MRTDHRARPHRLRATLAGLGVLTVSTLLVTACSRQAGEPVRVQAGPYSLEARLAPDPPPASGAQLRLRLLEPAPAEAGEVDIHLSYFMPAMGAMAEMRGNLPVERRGEGVHVARLDLPMAGSWRLDLEVSGRSGSGAAALGLTTGRKGLKIQEQSAPAASVPHAHGDEIAHYTCSMHPSVKAETPGTCPICSMDLVPVTEGELATGTIRIDPARRQEIGITTEVARRRPLSATVRAVGRVLYDETRKTDVSLKIGGWIGRLVVDRPGQYVARGQTMFTLYSPELYAAQQEYLTALASRQAAGSSSVPDRADYLVDAARQRLRLWDLSQDQIERLGTTGEALEYLPILAPVSGYVVEKNVVAGAAVQPGERLFRIAGVDRVWVEAQVYESQLSLVEPDQEARVTLPYLPGRGFDGRVSFIYPYLDDATRTGTVRIELANPDLELKPEMYADVVIRRDLGEQLSVPEEAVLYAGERSFVFVDRGDGRLQPRRVETGTVAGDRIAILSGLTPGETVVTSGNFLVAAEARLKLALEQWQ